MWKKINKISSFVTIAIKVFLCISFVFSVVLVCISAANLPMQKLKITAQTTADEFDLSGFTHVYGFERTDAGESYTAEITFMAVPNTSEKLFTHFGTGQCVYLGCGELKTECDFISFGNFFDINLTLNAAQTDLKLEDGTPFDITRYSLKPVLKIGE